MILKRTNLHLQHDTSSRKQKVCKTRRLTTVHFCWSYPANKKIFPVWLRYRLISGRYEPVLSHTKKSCIVSCYIQFSRNIKMYNHNIKTSFVSPYLRHLGDNKAGFNLIIVHFYIGGGKLFIIRCNR